MRQFVLVHFYYADRSSLNLILTMTQFAILSHLKKGFFLSAALALSTPVFAQPSIFTNAIFGTDPGFVSPFTAGQSTNPGITANGISRGPGLIGAPGDDRYNAAGFTTSTTLDPADYFQFALAPTAGNLINFSQFAFTLQINSVGPTSFALRSSLDGFTTDVAATGNVGNPIFASETGQVNTVSLTAPQFQNVGVPVTFRLYGFAANGNGAQLSVNDFAFTGTVSSTPLSNNLLAFDARSGSANVQLSWKTTCSSDARSFTVEKSVNGKDFAAIGAVDATTHACEDEGRAYTFTAPAEAGRTVYRLAMRDASGYLEYSRSVTLVANGAIASGVTVYPSLATSTLIVRGTDEGAMCHILDLNGRTLQSWKATGGQEAISVNNLAAGAYILVAEGSAGRATQRFWKQ
jgi:hypothetical protein